MFRTDLALELNQSAADKTGVKQMTKQFGDTEIDEIIINSGKASQTLGKPCGRYITLSVKGGMFSADTEKALKTALDSMLPEGNVLFAGLGNRDITPDALGPLTADRIMATRHIGRNLMKELGLGELRSVSVISPNVLGNTGLEAAETVKAAVEIAKPTTVVIVDALAARGIERLGCTVQISDTGICPGAGVGNDRKEMSETTLGTKVISIGIPTVTDLSTLVFDLAGKETENRDFITPKDIDLIIMRGAKLISRAVNSALQPTLSIEEIEELI